MVRDIIEHWCKNHTQTLSRICNIEPKYIQRLNYISIDCWDFKSGYVINPNLLKYTSHFCNICYFNLENNTIVFLDEISRPYFVYISFADSNEIFIVNRVLDYFDENITVAIVDRYHYTLHGIFKIADQDFQCEKSVLNYITLFKVNESFKLENFNVVVIGRVCQGSWHCRIDGYAVIRNYKQIITTPGITFEFEAYLSL